jgi:hypothetical protein
MFWGLLTFLLVCEGDRSAYGVGDTAGEYVRFLCLLELSHPKCLSLEVLLIGNLHLYNCELMF